MFNSHISCVYNQYITRISGEKLFYLANAESWMAAEGIGWLSMKVPAKIKVSAQPQRYKPTGKQLVKS